LQKGEFDLSKRDDVQKIAIEAEKIANSIYREEVFIVDRIKQEEVLEIIDSIKGIRKRIQKISVRNIE
jgi:murein L,D-transpeptidase YafK